MGGILSTEIILAFTQFCLFLFPIFPPTQCNPSPQPAHWGFAVPERGRRDGPWLEFGRSQIALHGPTRVLTLELAGARPVWPEAAKAGSFAWIQYTHPWPGVTAIYRAQTGAIMKSEYYVESGFSEETIAQIRIRYNRPVALTAKGGLAILDGSSSLQESAPVAWQAIEGRKIPVKVEFVQYSLHETGYAVRGYNAKYGLTIDPSLTWNTFLGGSGNDRGYAIATDGNGNVIVGGSSDATWGAPVRAFGGDYDAFAAKLDSHGNLLWNTFLGGAGHDDGYAIAVDGSGNVILGGRSDITWGAPLQGISGGYDAFAAKLESNGNLLWNTFLGGGLVDEGRMIAADGSGNVIVGGSSNGAWGAPLRAYSGGYDAFAAMLNNSGNLIWNTFLGGPGDDFGNAVDVDGSGNAVVGGQSYAAWGTPLRAYTFSWDAFAAKLDSSGNLLWNTFLGGGGSDNSQAMAVDVSGNAMVGGNSNDTWGSPLRLYSASTDAFAAKLDSNGHLLWNTFLGGAGDDWGNGIAVNSQGEIFLVGDSSEGWGSPTRAFGGGVFDDFAVKLGNDGALAWNMFLGGSGDDEYDGSTLVLDNNGSVYATGYSDAAWGAPIRAYGALYDAFAAKIFDIAPNTPTPTPSNTPTHTGTPVPTHTPTPTGTAIQDTSTLTPSETSTPPLPGTASPTQPPSPSGTPTNSEFQATGVPAPGVRFILLQPMARPGRSEPIRLRIQLDQNRRILVEVYDLRGRRIKMIADDWLPAGMREVTWDGEQAGSGLYILWVRVSEGMEEEKFKVLVLR